MEVNLQNLLKENQKLKTESEFEISALIKEKSNLELTNEKIQTESLVISEECKMVASVKF